MAIKYYCDGCGNEVAYDLVKKVAVRVEFTGDPGARHDGQYELCAGCAAQLVREANPRKWVRCAPEKRSVA